MDLTRENVSAVFFDSLALDAESTETVKVRGLGPEYVFDPSRLARHAEAIRGFLSRVPALFFEDRGGGHSVLVLGMRRDGVSWGDVADVDRLLALGIALGLIEFCLKRRRWHLFPRGVPFVRIKAEVFQLWATFHRQGGAPEDSEDHIHLPFAAESFPPPAGLGVEWWYRPQTFKVGALSGQPLHVAEPFYNRIIVDGFFDDHLPSWILDSETTLEIY